MMTGLAKRQQHLAPAVATSAVIPAPPADCNFSGIEFANTVTSHPSRFLSCSDTLLTVTVIQVEPTFLLLGTFFWEDQY